MQVKYEIDLILNLADSIRDWEKGDWEIAFEKRIFRMHDLGNMVIDLRTKTNGKTRITVYTDKINYSRNGYSLCYTLTAVVNTETDEPKMDRLINSLLAQQARRLATWINESHLTADYDRETPIPLQVTNFEQINEQFIEKSIVGMSK